MKTGKAILVVAALVLATGLAASRAWAQEKRAGSDRDTARIEEQMRQRRQAELAEKARQQQLAELAERAKQLRKDVEAALPARPKAVEGKDGGTRVIFNGKELKLDDREMERDFLDALRAVAGKAPGEVARAEDRDRAWVREQAALAEKERVAVEKARLAATEARERPAVGERPNPQRLEQLERQLAELRQGLERAQAENRELRAKLEGQRPRPEGDRPRAEGDRPREGDRPKAEGLKPRPEGAKEGEEGVRIIVDGREIKLGESKAGAGGFVVGQVRTGQPGGLTVRREGEEREGREGREGGEVRRFSVPVPPQPGARVQSANPDRTWTINVPAPQPEARPLAGGPGPWGRPMPGALGAPNPAPPPGQPFRPNVEAARQAQQAQQAPAQQLQQMMMMLNVYQQATFDPAKAGLAAIGGIKDDLARTPVGAIRVLEASLKGVRTPGLRIAIHLALKDLYKAQGKEDMVAQHLMAVIEESDAQMQGARPTAAMPRGPMSGALDPVIRREGPPAGAPAPMMRREGPPGATAPRGEPERPGAARGGPERREMAGDGNHNNKNDADGDDDDDGDEDDD